MTNPTGLLQWGPHTGPHHGPMGGVGGLGSGFLWGSLWILLTIILFVAIAYVAVQFLGNQEVTANTSEPIEILRRRYAAGEIDEEEFEARRRNLSQDHHS